MVLYSMPGSLFCFSIFRSSLQVRPFATEFPWRSSGLCEGPRPCMSRQVDMWAAEYMSWTRITSSMEEKGSTVLSPACYIDLGDKT